MISLESLEYGMGQVTHIITIIFLGKNLHQLAASGTMGGPAEVKAEPRAEPRAEPWAEPRWFRSSKPVEISGIRGPCPPLFEVPMALPMRSDAKLVT